MTTRWMRRGATGFAVARHVVMALGTGLTLVWLAHSVSAQAGQQQKPGPTDQSRFASPDEERAPKLPARPDFAPTKPWWGKFLPDGQPELPKGIWRAVNGGTRYVDRATGALTGSRVVDPPDAQLPYQPWALELKSTQDYDLEFPTKPWHVDTQPRCLNSVPRFGYYVTEYEIYQITGQIVFHFQLEHITRVIPLDGRPRIGSDIKLWMGDARGRWEGNTLLVDTTNLNGKTRLTGSGDFYTANMHLTERMTFVDPTTMVWEGTIDDPTVYTRPWTIRVEHKLQPKVFRPGREPEGEIVEYMCHEGSQDRPSVPPGTEP